MNIMAMPIAPRTSDTAAEKLDLSQTEFVLDEAGSEALARALSNPAEPNIALRSLMSSKRPWVDRA